MISKEAALALREITGPLMVVDESGTLVHVDEAFARLVGHTVAKLNGCLISDITADNADRLAVLLRQFSSGGDWMVGFLTLSGSDGVAIEFPCQGKVLQHPRGDERKLVVIHRCEHPGFAALNNRIRDVQAEMRRRHDAELRVRIASYALDHASDAMYWITPDGRLDMVNQQACRNHGYSREEIIGGPLSMLDPEVTEENWAEHWQNLKQLGKVYFERIHRRKDGSQFIADVVATYLRFEGTEFIFAVARDLTESRKTAQTINELAFFDRLTGLPNRTLLLDRLKQAMTAAHRNATCGAVLLIDLDDFKTLNDTRGHEVGDLLLKQVGQRLGECLREGDTVARFGGDEFVTVVSGLGTSEGDAAHALEHLAEKILASLKRPYPLGATDHHSSASIGATLFRGEGTSIEDLLKQAELAMYKSKAAGRNAIRFFDPTLEAAVHDRAALESDLRQALVERQFLLHYQPQVADSGVTGAEALVRWRHPQRGLVSPAEFIPLAEETGLILQLGQWVLETACRQLAAWATLPALSALTIAVNVSARQFRQTDFVDQVVAVLDSSGARPQRLKLELTESLLVENVDEVIEKMFALKAHGVGFSLDDFGTGYSSLTYLKRLPLDQLKIDQSFVRDVLTDPNDASIARTIIALAQNLGLGVIAEGVETEAQRQFLVGSGCHAYQGYLYSKPLPIEDFEARAQQAN